MKKGDLHSLLQDKELEEVNSLLSPEVAQQFPGSNPIEIPPHGLNSIIVNAPLFSAVLSTNCIAYHH
jgi:hypothetical protein